MTRFWWMHPVIELSNPYHNGGFWNLWWKNMHIDPTMVYWCHILRLTRLGSTWLLEDSRVWFFRGWLWGSESAWKCSLVSRRQTQVRPEDKSFPFDGWDCPCRFPHQLLTGLINLDDRVWSTPWVGLLAWCTRCLASCTHKPFRII